MNKKGQVSIEYIVIMGLVVLVVMIILGISFFYSSTVSDTLKYNQLENFANKVISNSESIYYSGEPSKITINAYLPSGVTELTILDNDLIIKMETGTGPIIIAYTSKIPLEGTISINEGLKTISLTATSDPDRVVILGS